jgi:uncharacterized protein
VKFLVDGMLGKLTRWLRMMGQDVVYSVKLGDDELLDLVKNESRALLTRDFELYKCAIARGLAAFYVDDRTESRRLAQVAKRYGVPLEIDMDKSHCPICNTPLKAVPREQLKDKLEKNTSYYDAFWRCPNCGQIYWQGAHWKQIQQTLTQAREKIKVKEQEKLS